MRRPVDIQAAVNQNLKPTDALQLPPQPLTALIAGGGTGGHVIPAIAIGEALMSRNRDSQVLILGSSRGIEADLVPKAGFELIQLPVKPMPRKFGLGHFVAGWRMLQSIRRAYGVIQSTKPDVVIGTGGYVSVAAIIAAKLARKPTLLQEQNSIPGRANRFLSRYADEVHIHFTESRRYFKNTGKLRLSGNPVRVKFPEGRAVKTMQKYQLHTDRKTVLILGGSQGAKSINQAFGAMLREFRGDRRIQFVIQTGKMGYRPVLDSVRNSGARVVVKSFLHDIHELYGVADLVVARAGAMTISELCACGLPSILVPYPYAQDDHQTANASALAEKDAAVVVADENLSGEVLAREITKLLDSPVTLQRMAKHAYRLSRPNAARHIAEAAEALAGAGPESILAIPTDLGQFETMEV